MRRKDFRIGYTYQCKTHLDRHTPVSLRAIQYCPTVGEYMAFIVYVDPLSPSGTSIDLVRPARLHPYTRKIGQRNERFK